MRSLERRAPPRGAPAAALPARPTPSLPAAARAAAASDAAASAAPGAAAAAAAIKAVNLKVIISPTPDNRTGTIKKDALFQPAALATLVVLGSDKAATPQYTVAVPLARLLRAVNIRDVKAQVRAPRARRDAGMRCGRHTVAARRAAGPQSSHSPPPALPAATAHVRANARRWPASLRVATRRGTL